MLNAISAVFPKRPLVLKEAFGKSSSFASTLVLIVVLGGIGLAALLVPWFSLLPGIQRDWLIAQDAEKFNPSEQFAAPFRSGSAVTGKCESIGGVLQSCEVRVSYRDSKGNARASTLDFTFLDISFSNYTVDAVRSASNPDLISVDLAVNKIGNRIAVMAIMMLFGAAMIVMVPYILRKNSNMRNNVQSLSGQILTPVAVNITSQTTTYGATAIAYTFNSGSGIKKYSVNFGKQAPFLLRPNTTEALGLTAHGQNYVFLVDEALSLLDLNDAERQAIKQVRAGVSQPET